MQNIPMAIERRLRAEWLDFDVSYPHWLRSILDDELYYMITLITICANSFAIGLVLGWLLTI